MIGGADSSTAARVKTLSRGRSPSYPPSAGQNCSPRQPLFSMTQPWERDVVEGPWMTHHRNGYYLLYSGAMLQAGTGHLSYDDLGDRLSEVASLLLGPSA